MDEMNKFLENTKCWTINNDDNCTILEFNDFGVVYRDENKKLSFIPYNNLSYITKTDEE